MQRNVILLAVLFITGCAPGAAVTSGPETLPPDTAVTSPARNDPITEVPVENPFAPQAGDSKLSRGEVFVDESGLLIRESYPPQLSLHVSGNLPTPCHQLRVAIQPPDAEHKINADVYSVVDPDMLCTQVLKPFSASINLGIFPSGHYSVWINGQSVGEFDS